MAAYREHITVSSFLGIGVGLGSSLAFGFTPVQGLLAAWLTAIGGILPDLDSESGRPVREMFGLTAAVAPLLLIGRVLMWAGLKQDPETVMVLFLAMYLSIKYGLAAIVGTLSVHRGMFHSVPALLIASEATYLCYPSAAVKVKLLMAGATGLGFLSHLVLDEIYSVQWSGVRITLKKSAGSALKFFGHGFGANAVTYVLLTSLTIVTLTDAGLIGRPAPGGPGGPGRGRVAGEDHIIMGDAAALPQERPPAPEQQPAIVLPGEPEAVQAIEFPPEHGILR